MLGYIGCTSEIIVRVQSPLEMSYNTKCDNIWEENNFLKTINTAGKELAGRYERKQLGL